MKKTNILVFIIATFLFFIPFFWLKPGEMNLGGDSGRLYFYDPPSYLKYYTLYVYSSSGAGNEIFSYSSLFYTSVLFVFKLIFSSPTILISIFNGIVLSCSFLSIYFIVYELLNNFKNPIKKSVVVCSSILAGFLYIFSQLSIYSGWENPILSHNQIFLNPLIFLLLLKYFITRKKLYMSAVVLISVIFAANFSFQGAPTFFAFYPLSLTFLVCYVKFIRKLSILFKGLIFWIVLLLLAHSFHLIPEIASLFSFGSSLSKTVFIQEGANSRMGLAYFISVASSVKVSLIWLSAAQFQSALIFSIFIIFPITFMLGFYFNKGKTLLLTGVFFLVAMFFTSANITDTGFFLYKQLFKMPGFSMFRNYHGQWLHIYLFFYVLVFGQTFAIIASKLSRRLFFIFIFVFTLVILGFGMPLITGAVSIVTHKENGIRYVFRMDPIYEKVLDYFKKNPIDEKTISFPLTSPGFQIIQGIDGGVYQGLQTISYLTGKSNFSGYETLRPFNEIFFQAMYDKNYEVIKKILSVLNIHHIFYNSDPYIYSDNFQAYLYNYISKFSPKDQKEYRKFVEKISEGNRIDFGKNYHIYSLSADSYLPHIFVATETLYTNNQIALALDQDFRNELRTVPVPMQNTIDYAEKTVLYAKPEDLFSKIINNSHLHQHAPFISIAMNNPLYIFTSLKEKLTLFLKRNNPDDYVDLSLYLIAKRILEPIEFSRKLPLHSGWQQEPRFWEVYKWRSYNSWDASMARYEKQVDEFLSWINNLNMERLQREAYRIKLNEQVFQHQVVLLRAMKDFNRSDEEKKYVLSLIDKTFNKVFQKVNIPLHDVNQYVYNLPAHQYQQGNYEMFLRGIPGDSENATLKIGNEAVEIKKTSAENNIIKFKNYFINNQADRKISLDLPPDNLVAGEKWESTGSVVEVDNTTILSVSNKIDENTKGLTITIPKLSKKNKYFITFDYKTANDNFLISLYDGEKINDAVKNNTYKRLFEKVLKSSTWKTHQSFFDTNDWVDDGFLQITPFSPNDNSKIYIKNLRVTQFNYPEIIFKKLSSGDMKQAIPKIIFTKINSTKYRINIVGATNPYTLVFLETFSENWKLFNPEKNTASIKGYFSRFLSIISKEIVSVFIKEDISTQIIASYFNGDVKEGKHTNTFLAPNTFETWGKEVIADARHYESFDYANSWVINPEDMDEKKDYTLILEYIPQKKFYFALCLSLLTLFCIISYIIKIIIFKK